ncbi:hypothetical protein [Microvirga makkahensis]|uniref:Uncharacterized protein n=1 Tax=Microvirga makkahensis TaxID=1128670 RepID=A0A7X3MR57_9HYPH|nr:hypothetical protein [Microvirga makkahensis]MXQ11485.1 hypothetical protein [Microvirga makkahensis]
MGIITAAILLVIGYVVITKVVGLAFRLVVPVVLIAILAGAGIFTDLLPGDRSARYPADHDRPHRMPADGGRWGDIRLGDIADAVIAAAQSFLHGTQSLLDRAAEPRVSEQPPPSSDFRHRPRTRYGEEMPAYDDPPSWDRGRSGQAY